MKGSCNIFGSFFLSVKIFLFVTCHISNLNFFCNFFLQLTRYCADNAHQLTVPTQLLHTCYSPEEWRIIFHTKLHVIKHKEKNEYFYAMYYNRGLPCKYISLLVSKLSNVLDFFYLNFRDTNSNFKLRLFLNDIAGPMSG